MSHDREFNQVLLATVEREQRMLAEKLHDTVCQSLAGTSLLLKVLHRRLNSGNPVDPADIAKISRHLDDAIDCARAPFYLQALLTEETGLARALEELTRLTAKRIRCHFDTEGEIKIEDPLVTQVFYRIAREVIGNILERGKAKEITISLLQKKNLLVLDVQGNAPQASGRAKETLQGLDFLRRYADAVGMDLTIKSSPGGGLRVRCTYPFKNLRARSGQSRSSHPSVILSMSKD
jgi:signal transduction histidine kinase